jgi:hypothetical protein
MAVRRVRAEVDYVGMLPVSKDAFVPRLRTYPALVGMRMQVRCGAPARVSRAASLVRVCQAEASARA